MRIRPKSASLEAHLDVRRRLASARREAQALGHVANVMLEVEREIARLDAKILDLEEKIARLSDDHKAQRESFSFWRFKIDLVVNDKKQLRELLAVLRGWREHLSGEEGRRAVGAARMLSDWLTGADKIQVVYDKEPPPSIEAPHDGLNGSASKSRRYG